MTPNELKDWRKKNGLSQAAAAAKLGCSRRGIQQWESGAYPVPKKVALAVTAVSADLPPYGKKQP
jgi:transcriptional regulator with XRE-family HTH domain